MGLLNYRKFLLIKSITLYFLGALFNSSFVHAHLKIESTITYYHEMPVVNLAEGKNKFQIVIDIGSLDLMLSEDILRRHAVPTSKPQRFEDATGKQYVVPIWQLKNFYVFNFPCKNQEALVYTEFGFKVTDIPYKDELKALWGLIYSQTR